jgi:hypothetical protein
MHKRPTIRQRFPPTYNNQKHDVKPGTFLYNIVKPPPVRYYTHKPQPVYRKEDYLRLLAKNRVDLGLEPKEMNIPDWNPPVIEERKPESHIFFANPVHLQIRILKNGTIRVKLNTAIGDLYTKYYSKQKAPPLKAVVQAYKSIGYSNAFLEKIIKSHDRKIKITESFNLDTAFGKEPVKKKKKKEEPEPEPELEEEEDEEDEEEDDLGEDGEMDVERDDDDEVVDQNAEEFIDDDE